VALSRNDGLGCPPRRLLLPLHLPKLDDPSLPPGRYGQAAHQSGPRNVTDAALSGPNFKAADADRSACVAAASKSLYVFSTQESFHRRRR